MCHLGGADHERCSTEELIASAVLLFYHTGIVPSSVVLTGFQVLSRVFLTWAVTHSVQEVRPAVSYQETHSLEACASNAKAMESFS